jgi:hypothetical protein
MALDGLIKAALSGYTGYLTGRDIREQRKAAEAEKAYERERQAKEDALRESMLKAQAEANEALALQRRTPDAPTVRNIDPLSPEGIRAAADRAAMIERARNRIRGTSTGGFDVGLVAPRAPTPAAGQVSSYVDTVPTAGRTANQVASAAYLAWLKDLRPDQRAVRGSGIYRAFLKRAQDRLDRAQPAGSGSLAGQLRSKLGLGGGVDSLATSPAAAPIQPGYTPEARARFNAGQQAPSAPTMQRTRPADRWEELVNAGMDKDEATAQVKREFNLP